MQVKIGHLSVIPCLLLMINEDTYFKMYDEILNQLMESDEKKKLKVWASDVESREVYLTAKKTSP